MTHTDCNTTLINECVIERWEGRWQRWGWTWERGFRSQATRRLWATPERPGCHSARSMEMPPLLLLLMLLAPLGRGELEEGCKQDCCAGTSRVASTKGRVITASRSSRGHCFLGCCPTTGHSMNNKVSGMKNGLVSGLSLHLPASGF